MAKKKAAEDNGNAGRLLGLLDSVGEADLKAINEKVAGINAQIEALALERKGLHQIRRMIDIKLHGMPMEKRASPAERCEKIAEYLGEEGPATVREIAVATEVPIPSVRLLLKRKQFAQEENGRWGLVINRAALQGRPTSAGRSMAPHA